MNAFARHGIRHLSPSSLNLWREQPGLWTLRYLNGFREDAGAAAWRGSAVEAGLEHFLRKRDLEAAELHAVASFEANAQGLADDETDAERQLLVPMLRRAVDAFCEAPDLIATQLKVELFLDGVPVPVIGYADFVLEDGSIIDLKTTKQCPSAPKPDHARQVALYSEARQAPASLLYVTAKRSERYPVEDTAPHIAAMRRDALALQWFLERHEDGQSALRSLPCNTDHFFWSDNAIRRLIEIVDEAA